MTCSAEVRVKSVQRQLDAYVEAPDDFYEGEPIIETDQIKSNQRGSFSETLGLEAVAILRQAGVSTVSVEQTSFDDNNGDPGLVATGSVTVDTTIQGDGAAIGQTSYRTVVELTAPGTFELNGTLLVGTNEDARIPEFVEPGLARARFRIVAIGAGLVHDDVIKLDGHRGNFRNDIDDVVSVPAGRYRLILTAEADETLDPGTGYGLQTYASFDVDVTITQ